MIQQDKCDSKEITSFNQNNIMMIITCGDNILMIDEMNDRGKKSRVFPTVDCKCRFLLAIKYISKKKIFFMTGLKIKLKKLIFNNNNLYIFTADIKKGELALDATLLTKNSEDNTCIKPIWINRKDIRLYNDINKEIINVILDNTREQRDILINLSAFEYRK